MTDEKILENVLTNALYNVKLDLFNQMNATNTTDDLKGEQRDEAHKLFFRS